MSSKNFSDSYSESEKASADRDYSVSSGLVIKTFIPKFTAVLLDEFPVALDGSIFMRFSIKSIHNLDTHATHSMANKLE